MRSIIPTGILAILVALVMLPIAPTAAQSSCRFVLGFATLRDLVGADKVGSCLEDEHFNLENGNAEQRTSGGLLVWRKIDNFTAFTDGGTTWVNGPNGLQSRPNSERFSWEKDPIQPARQASTSPSSGPVSAGPGSAISVANSNPSSNSTTSQVVAPTNTPKPAVPTNTPAPTKVPTATPNPVEAKFKDVPDEITTGETFKVEVETNAKKGTCSFLLTLKGQSQQNYGAVEIDDKQCEFKLALPIDAKTGKAKLEIVIQASEPVANITIDEDIEVKKGDTAYGGDPEMEAEADIPDDVKVGQEFDIKVDTSLKNKGYCDLSVSWPKQGGATQGERKTPDGSGKCSWKMTPPATIEKNGEATVTIFVTNKSGSSSYRTVTKEIDVKK